MPRNAQIEPHLTPDELETQFKNATDPREARRWQLLWLISLNHQIDFAASVTGSCYSSARNILKKYNQHGPHSIPDKRKTRTHTPRKPLLNETQQQQLIQALQHPHPDGGLWTGPKVAAWIEAQTGRKRVLPQLGWTYLKRLGFSLQRPRPRHQQASAEAQAAFKKSSSRFSRNDASKPNEKASRSQPGRWMSNDSD
jgi:transposase